VLSKVDIWASILLIVCGWLQGEAGIVLESPVQKTRGFTFQIALPWWFLERAYQVFGEMSVRI
jgi:hypothetical protein